MGRGGLHHCGPLGHDVARRERLELFGLANEGGKALGGQEGGDGVYAASNMCSMPRTGLEAVLGSQGGGRGPSGVERVFGVTKKGKGGRGCGGHQGGDGGGCGVHLVPTRIRE
jgi:hypothetical protein